MSLRLQTCFDAARENHHDPYDICLATERELANHGIRVGITEVVLIHENQPHARGCIVDISFSLEWGFYAVFVGTLFSGGDGNCFIPDYHNACLAILN